MDLKEFAQMLNGREYRSELTSEEEQTAKDCGFVVVFGYSDDNCELRGAICDEIDCYDGGVITHEELPFPINAIWCPEDIKCSWIYRTNMPHEKFNIYSNGELYCVGIVVDLNAMNSRKNDKKYIDAELLKAELKSLNESERLCYMGVFDIINKQSTSEVVEVRHGKWVFEVECGGCLDYNVTAKCSECGWDWIGKDDECVGNNRYVFGAFVRGDKSAAERFVLDNAKHRKLYGYCPNCGAKMDKKSEEIENDRGIFA